MERENIYCSCHVFSNKIKAYFLYYANAGRLDVSFYSRVQMLANRGFVYRTDLMHQGRIQDMRKGGVRRWLYFKIDGQFQRFFSNKGALLAHVYALHTAKVFEGMEMVLNTLKPRQLMHPRASGSR
jgi:hypothetical protein